MPLIQVTISDVAHAKLRALCAETSNTASGILETAIEALSELGPRKRAALVEAHGTVRRPGPGRPKKKENR